MYVHVLGIPLLLVLVPAAALEQCAHETLLAQRRGCCDARGCPPRGPGTPTPRAFGDIPAAAPPTARPAGQLGWALATLRRFSPAELAVLLPATLDRVSGGLRRGALQRPADSLRAVAPEAVT